LPYTTAGHMSCTLSFNKFACNTFLKQCGVISAPSAAVYSTQPYNEEDILKITGLPCFVKPSDGGSSFGISKVTEANQLAVAIEKAFQAGSEVIVEAFIEGSEITCGIIEKEGDITALPLTEIISDNEFFDFEAKYLGQSKEITPARISPELTNKIQAIAKRVFLLMNMRHLARVDFIVKDNQPYLIEANAVPGLSAESLIPQMAEAANLPLSTMFGDMIENTLKG